MPFHTFLVGALYLETVARPVVVAASAPTGKHMETPLVVSWLGLELKMEVVVVALCGQVDWMLQDFQETGESLDPLDP